MTRKDAPPRTIGARRPLATGLAFGLTNPKSYPVALAMFSAIVAPYVGAASPRATRRNCSRAAFAGFLAADATLIFAAGLPAVRRFFLAHGVVGDAGRRPDVHRLRRQVAVRRGERGDAAGGVSGLGM